MRPIQVIISSEHSGNNIPEQFKKEFTKAEKALNSHRGIDFGAAYIAGKFNDSLNAQLIETNTSRLLVDCNRGLHRDDLFSEFSKTLEKPIQNEILKKYYFPHRHAVEEYVKEYHEKNIILHLSIHTFTPVWNGVERSMDIGLLFDEARSFETVLCTFWQDELEKLLPSKNTVHNKPYTGADDGLTAHLRTIFPNESYMGIEIEVNQKYAETSQMPIICEALVDSLKTTIVKMNSSLADIHSIKL